MAVPNYYMTLSRFLQAKIAPFGLFALLCYNVRVGLPEREKGGLFMRFSVKTVVLYLFGLFLLSVGMAVSNLSELGITPVSSVPRVLSEILQMGFGTATTLVFSVFVLVQLLILGRDFKWFNLFQVAVAFLFGFFVDFSGFLFGLFLPSAPAYPLALVYVLFSTALLALGIFVYLRANLLMLPVEGLVLAITQKVKRPMPLVKQLFDGTMVTLSIGLSLGLLGYLAGVREGTLISAFGVGFCLKQYERFLGKRFDRFLAPSSI